MYHYYKNNNLKTKIICLTEHAKFADVQKMPPVTILNSVYVFGSTKHMNSAVIA